MWSGKCSAETLEQRWSAHFWQRYFLALTFLYGDRFEEQAKERQERLSFLCFRPYSQFFFLYCLYSFLSFFLIPLPFILYLFLFTFLSYLSHSFLCAFANIWKATISFVMSVCPPASPRGTARLSLDGFLWNLALEIFQKSV